VFVDLLDWAIWCLLLHDHAKLGRNPMANYKPDEQKQMLEMFQICGDMMEDFTDAFGDFFMEYLSFGKNGQFFTPQPICDMMALMTYSENPAPADKKTTVMDCACGSGRTLLAAARMNRNQLFYGSDLDLTCVKMAVVNLAYNSLEGEIHWMNALSLEHYGTFRIGIDPLTRLPYIIILPADKSISVNAVKQAAQKMPEHQKQQVVAQAKQLNLF
jgi:ribosomal protein L11 methylase PrmA